jgi:hypothetical protein
MASRDPALQPMRLRRAALDLFVEHVRTRPDARVFLTSHVVGPTSPKSFYLQYGFRPTDRVEGGAPILDSDLYPEP